jgi:hypothetical protein
MCIAADLDDHEWFHTHPGRFHRIRKPFPGEFESDAHAPPIEWSLVSQVAGAYFRLPLHGHIGGRAGCPDEERLLSNLWAMYFLKRNNSPYFKDVHRLTTAICAAPRAS